MERAEQEYSQAVQLNPDSLALAARAALRAAVEDYAGALEDYSSLIGLDAKNASAHNSRGNIYLALEDAEAALADFSTAIELDPSLTSAYSSRAHILSQQDDAKAALADYTSLIEQDPQNASAYYARGNAHREAGDVEAALADFTCHRDRSRPRQRHQQPGAFYANGGEYALAIADCMKPFSNLGRRTAAYAGRERLRQLGDIELALDDLNHALNSTPNLTSAYLSRAHTAAKLEDYTQASADYAKVLSLEPDNIEGAPVALRSASCKGNTDSAIADFTEAAELARLHRSTRRPRYSKLLMT